MDERSISICFTYFEFLLCDDTQSLTRKLMCRNAIELHSPSDSPFPKLLMDFNFIYEAHSCVISVPGVDRVELSLKVSRSQGSRDVFSKC